MANRGRARQRRMIIAGALGVALLSGACQRQPSKPVAAAETDAVDGPDELNAELAAKLAERQKAGSPAKVSPKAPAAEAVARTLKADEQWCFECQHTGAIPCRTEGCQAGYVRCPGACVQLGRGTWVPDPSHPGQMGYKMRTGPRSSSIIPVNHVGDIYTVQDGKAVWAGNCPTCKGTTKVRCKTCDATGKLPCPLCNLQRVGTGTSPR